MSRYRSRSLLERRQALHAGPERRSFTFTPEQVIEAIGERRSLPIGAQSVTADDIVPLIGYAIRYGAAYDVTDRLGTFSEEMRSGACSQTLAADDDCVFLYDHEGLVLGRRSAGTLRLGEDANGLAIGVDLDTRQQIARDLSIAIERGDVTQMSVGFSVPAGGDQWNAAGTVRKISQIRLFDVSAVGIPASPTTSIGIAQAATGGVDGARSIVRSLIGALEGMPEARGELPEEHRALSAASADTLAESLSALNLVDDFALPVVVLALEAIDKALDDAQAAVSEVLGVADPDGGPDDLEPALVEDGDAPEDEEAEARARQRQSLDLRRKRLALR